MDDPENWLRQLAKAQSDYIENAPRTPATLSTAWGISRGAVLALAAVGVLDSVKGFALVDEVLTPATQATRSRGSVERINVSVESVHTATGVQERQFLLDAVAVMVRRAFISHEDAAAIEGRIKEKFEGEGDATE